MEPPQLRSLFGNHHGEGHHGEQHHVHHQSMQPMDEEELNKYENTLFGGGGAQEKAYKKSLALAAEKISEKEAEKRTKEMAAKAAEAARRRIQAIKEGQAEMNAIRNAAHAPTHNNSTRVASLLAHAATNPPTAHTNHPPAALLTFGETLLGKEVHGHTTNDTQPNHHGFEPDTNITMEETGKLSRQFMDGLKAGQDAEQKLREYKAKVSAQMHTKDQEIKDKEKQLESQKKTLDERDAEIKKENKLVEEMKANITQLKAEHDRVEAEMKTNHEKQIASLTAAHEQQVATHEAAMSQQVANANAAHDAALLSEREKHNAVLKAARDAHDAALAAVKAEHETQLRQKSEELSELKKQLEASETAKRDTISKLNSTQADLTAQLKSQGEYYAKTVDDIFKCLALMTTMANDVAKKGIKLEEEYEEIEKEILKPEPEPIAAA